eukprot:GFUD01003825.1.p1 GENE.GFUD01003825.1~~GFUD01003825.1.p1  ORF type:complete len:477 (+),score=119.21 GFUD01003825.1:72-1502(+)
MSLERSMSTGMLGQGTLRRPNRPRPLKLGTQNNRLSAIELSSVEDIIVLMENVCRHLTNRNYERSVLSGLVNLCMSLKKNGPQLENLYKDQLDKLGVSLRNACRDEELDLVSRVHLLEIIELRAMNWIPNENVNGYYKQKLSQFDNDGMQTPSRDSPQIHTAPVTLNANAPDFNPIGIAGANMLQPGEVIAISGRFNQPTKIPGKNYFKDEVVIRNADSGKVMGLKGRRVHMIEELTESIISFQRVVPGARERLVQITGPAQENILQAKGLIEDTIRRNQSPVPRDERADSPQGSLGSSENDSKRNTLVAEREVPIHEYKYTVNVGEECIKITGASLDLVRTAKLVLDEYFSLEEVNLTADTHIDDMVMATQNPSLDSQKDIKSENDPNPGPLSPESRSVKVVRQPLFPGAPKSAFASVESTSASISARRAMFAKTAKDVEMKDESLKVERSTSKSGSRPDITYDRADIDGSVSEL